MSPYPYPMQAQHKHLCLQAFSLVELSIVLVILGLLTGGILAGQSLIRAAELRSVTSDLGRYSAASRTFRDKYMGVPGDLLTATRFWGDNNSYCPDGAIANGTPGTCNGNGNGLVADSLVATGTQEYTQALLQLSLAGLIEGSYAGIFLGVPGDEFPRAKLPNSYWWYRQNNGT